MEWIKKNKDWLLTLAVFLFFVVSLSLYGLFFSDRDRNNDIPVVEEEATFTPETSPTESSSSDKSEVTAQPKTSFFLRPGPEELLEKLEGLDFKEFEKETANLPGLRIMWPAYFFAVTEVNGDMASVLLDASEDGFGVQLKAEIDVNSYPEILDLERGTKIWLAAEISGVDPTGTGLFMLTTEYVRFDDYQPPQPTPSEETGED